MGARVKMNPQALTSEMLLLIEAQAGDAEIFTLPGDVVAKMAQLARRGMATANPFTPQDAHPQANRKAMLPHPDPSDEGQPFSATRKAPGERTALSLVDAKLLDTAQQMVRFLSLEQRNALRVALVEAL